MHSLKIQVLGLIRYLRPDHNPLRRPVDRAHSRLVAGLAVLFLITGLITLGVTVRLVGATGLRAEHLQAQTRHRTNAVVIGTTTGSRNTLERVIRLRWQDASGTVRTGTVAPGGNDRVGATRTVWVDQNGALTGPPRTHDQTITDTALIALAGLTALMMLHAGAYTMVDRRLERRRLALWEEAWAATAPRWTGRP